MGKRVGRIGKIRIKRFETCDLINSLFSPYMTVKRMLTNFYHPFLLQATTKDNLLDQTDKEM